MDLFAWKIWTPLGYFRKKCNFNQLRTTFSPMRIPEADFQCSAFWSSGSDALPLGLPALKKLGTVQEIEK